MNRNMSTYVLLGSGIAMAAAIVLASMLFFDAREAKKRVVTLVKEEVIEEQKAAIEPAYRAPQIIFPSYEEAQENLKNQLERQQLIEKVSAEKKQIMIDVRKNVEASINEQLASEVEQAAPTNERIASINEQPAQASEAVNAIDEPRAATGDVLTTFLDEQNDLNLKKGTTDRSGSRETALRH